MPRVWIRPRLPLLLFCLDLQTQFLPKLRTCFFYIVFITDSNQRKRKYSTTTSRMFFSALDFPETKNAKKIPLGKLSVDRQNYLPPKLPFGFQPSRNQWTLFHSEESIHQNKQVLTNPIEFQLDGKIRGCHQHRTSIFFYSIFLKTTGSVFSINVLINIFETRELFLIV